MVLESGQGRYDFLFSEEGGREANLGGMAPRMGARTQREEGSGGTTSRSKEGYQKAQKQHMPQTQEGKFTCSEARSQIPNIRKGENIQKKKGFADTEARGKASHTRNTHMRGEKKEKVT